MRPGGRAAPPMRLKRSRRSASARPESARVRAHDEGCELPCRISLGRNAMADAVQEMRLLAIARSLGAGAGRAVPLHVASPPADAAWADAGASDARAGCGACRRSDQTPRGAASARLP